MENLLEGADWQAHGQAPALHTEAGELTAIAVSSIRTARAGKITPQSALRTPHSR